MPLEYPEAWEDDGFVNYTDEEIATTFKDLGCLAFEVEGMMEACKREAWVMEKLAKHEDREDNLMRARFWWRRTDRLRAVIKLMKTKKDESGEES